MKISIERNDLVDALSTVSSIIDSRNTIPIMSNVLLNGAEGAITFTTSNLDMGMVQTKPAVIEGEGSVTVSARNLLNLIKKFRSDETISLEVSSDTKTLLVSNGKKTNYKFPTLPPEDFVPLSVEGDTNEFEITASALLRLLNKVRFAISTEETRYYLNGIFLHVYTADDKPKFRAVATDGHRLSCVDTEVPESCKNFESGAIVPRQVIAVLDKLVGNTDDPVYFSFTENMVGISIGQIRIISKLIDGKFPDYSRVIPQNNKIELLLDNTSFRDAVDRVQVMSEERARSIKISLDKDQAHISVDKQSVGSGLEEVEAKYDSAPMAIGFNALYLLDVLKLIEDDLTTVMISDMNSPALILDKADSDCLYVIMPLRV